MSEVWERGELKMMRIMNQGEEEKKRKGTVNRRKAVGGREERSEIGMETRGESHNGDKCGKCSRDTAIGERPRARREERIKKEKT